MAGRELDDQTSPYLSNGSSGEAALTRRRAAEFAVVAASLGTTAWLVVWEGRQRYGTPAAHWSTSAVIVGMIVAASTLGRGRQRQPSGVWLADLKRRPKSLAILPIGGDPPFGWLWPPRSSAGTSSASSSAQATYRP